MARKCINRIKKFFSIIFSSVVFAIALICIINAQYIHDQVNVWLYNPTEQIVSFADRAGFSDDGYFVYLASQPTLDGTQAFNSACENVENVASILGCYKDNKIYIYNVSDQKLDGIREVTAAHETLHAIYVRLSSGERKSVDSLLDAEYAKIKDDVAFKSKLEFYARTEPGQLNNELHSVIGTEVANISPELEEYYSKYFTNRKNVVSLNQKYLNVFNDLKTQATTISDQINSIVSEINQKTSQYNADVSILNSDISNFNYRADNSWFNTQDQFDQERAGLVGRVNDLTNDKNSISDSINQYETLVAEYNSIATESKKLYNSLDSSLAPTPAI